MHGHSRFLFPIFYNPIQKKLHDELPPNWITAATKILRQKIGYRRLRRPLALDPECCCLNRRSRDMLCVTIRFRIHRIGLHEGDLILRECLRLSPFLHEPFPDSAA
jgi:hypothetical protein